jgi:hypothetical protein
MELSYMDTKIPLNLGKVLLRNLKLERRLNSYQTIKGYVIN